MIVKHGSERGHDSDFHNLVRQPLERGTKLGPSGEQLAKLHLRQPGAGLDVLGEQWVLAHRLRGGEGFGLVGEALGPG